MCRVKKKLWFENHGTVLVDGTSIPRRILNIDLPSVMPTISVLLILKCGSMLGVGYEKIFLMQNNLNLVGLSKE